MVAKEKLLC